VSANTLYSFMWRQRERDVIPMVTNRDLRRTWKTLAGQAGVSKEIRDRLQNHTLQDVSSKSYDRWNYMPEKRPGMEKWDAFVRTLLRLVSVQGLLDSFESLGFGGPIMIRGGASIVDGQEPGEVQQGSPEISERPDG
jgi:hypothetical protein